MGEDCSEPTKQFHMSTHCQPPAARDLKGTLGTPIGIIRVACRRGPLEELQTGRFLCVCLCLTIGSKSGPYLLLATAVWTVSRKSAGCLVAGKQSVVKAGQ